MSTLLLLEPPNSNTISDGELFSEKRVDNQIIQFIQQIKYHFSFEYEFEYLHVFQKIIHHHYGEYYMF